MLGVALGVGLGIGVIVAFLFLGSEETIDAPRLSGVERRTSGQDPGLPFDAGRTPVVRVIDGAPPATGPARLDFRRGQRVRFRVIANAAVAIEVPGYRVSQTVESGDVVSFQASRPGQFPVIVSGSHIGIASLRVTG